MPLLDRCASELPISSAIGISVWMIPVTGASGGLSCRWCTLDKISWSRHIRGVALPRVQPIIPTWRKEPFDDPDWLFEFKYDGFRGLCYLEQGRCYFISRNGNMLSRFDALADQVGRLLDVDEAIIDGEVIAVDESGRPQFYELLRVPRSASYVAFDILWAEREAPAVDDRL